MKGKDEYHESCARKFHEFRYNCGHGWFLISERKFENFKWLSFNLLLIDWFILVTIEQPSYEFRNF